MRHVSLLLHCSCGSSVARQCLIVVGKTQQDGVAALHPPPWSRGSKMVRRHHKKPGPFHQRIFFIEYQLNLDPFLKSITGSKSKLTIHLQNKY